MAMKAMEPKEMTPELPMKMYRPTTTTTRISASTVVRCWPPSPKAHTRATAATSSSDSDSAGHAHLMPPSRTAI